MRKYYQNLSDEEILSGFREGDSDIIREYFYGYCQQGYYIFDKRYQLSSKENLDFMSLAHQYALYLMEHDWRLLEDHSPNVSFRTWLINGFRYIVLDALKWYKKEYGTVTFEDYLRSFDVTDNLRLQFNHAVEDICDHAPLSRQERLIIDMLLIQGYKGKEVAAQMGMTPSAISQKYKKLMEQVIEPYFKKNFDMEMCEVIEEPYSDYGSMPMCGDIVCQKIQVPNMEQKRTTPEYITSLQHNEVFVFGSNLRGMHGGGAAYVAYRKFGAIMGKGIGFQGRSYAIPTMQGGVETIRPYVDEFFAFAEEHQNLTFLVTRIGCGIAGFTDAEISPLFEKAHGMPNIVLPLNW